MARAAPWCGGPPPILFRYGIPVAPAGGRGAHRDAVSPSLALGPVAAYHDGSGLSPDVRGGDFAVRSVRVEASVQTLLKIAVCWAPRGRC